MNSKIKYLLITIIICGGLNAQLNELNINKGNCQLFKGNLYCYGFINSKPNPLFCVYRLDLQLRKKDSLIIGQTKTSVENFLLLYSDTLHDYLNIYSQRRDQKTGIGRRGVSVGVRKIAEVIK